MITGKRILGIAESYQGRSDLDTQSTLGGAVIRGDKTVDTLIFGRCRVGGLDATQQILSMWKRLDRPDIQYLLIAGIAPAWFNIIDLDTLATKTDRPIIVVTYEASEGLQQAITREFSGTDRRHRLERYEALPPRHRLLMDDRTLYWRVAGQDPETIPQLLESVTHTAYPEPLRVAKLLAQAGDAFRRL